MKKKAGILLSLTLAASTLLGACGKSEETSGGKSEKKESDFKVGMVTDTGGVDDKSFNQSAWEGIKRFGEGNGLKDGKGFKYLQSNVEADYVPNLTKFAESKYDITYAIGYMMMKSTETIADKFPKNNFAIVDTVVEKPNVASIVFNEQDGSFLVGVAAAMTSKTGKIGFIGGTDSPLIRKFEAGFVQGAKAINPNIEINSKFAGDFNKSELGTQLASAMYGQGADIIYHAAGGTGKGVFTEAKNRKKKGENVWVIGVDRDQHDEGLPEDVTLTSMIKRVDIAVEKMSKDVMDGNFPGGKVVKYGFKEEGLDYGKKNLSKDIQAKMEEYKKQILDGTLKVTETLPKQ
ncbi:BMP family lipoprotein [Priestia taiwanensis]|uniref:BMP family ABC transporter substrate-binding protein n=1 Tax=Priestia taiwanensis TaxID=1347902 RepID=A0A917AQC3_9BACI|nr:BMP family ABC transporter substrate-binding protein [Priestia taiwanensis]MBM7362783.1 basic membrane protein A [Priestia taiwanensis]GGE65054.1 BMP family ABC transporter substrate-binding protein [Priestia taiwanensis]